jgi:hypothetical protein
MALMYYAIRHVRQARRGTAMPHNGGKLASSLADFRDAAHDESFFHFFSPDRFCLKILAFAM